MLLCKAPTIRADFADMAYNNTVHSSTRFTWLPGSYWDGFRSNIRVPPGGREELDLQNWIVRMQRVWGTAREVLQKLAKDYKCQADKKWSPQPPFHIEQQVYLSTKYLKLKVPCTN